MYGSMLVAVCWLLMQAFVRWLWHVCLSALSPTSSFPSRTSALSILAVFLRELPQPRLSCTTSTFLAHYVYLLIRTAHIVCAAGSMQLSGVRPSVRLSVCLSIRPLHHSATAAGLLLCARRAGDSAAQPHSSTVCSGKSGQCHVVSCCRKLNSDLLTYLVLWASPPVHNHSLGRMW